MQSTAARHVLPLEDTNNFKYLTPTVRPELASKCSRPGFEPYLNNAGVESNIQRNTLSNVVYCRNSESIVQPTPFRSDVTLRNETSLASAQERYFFNDDFDLVSKLQPRRVPFRPLFPPLSYDDTVFDVKPIMSTVLAPEISKMVVDEPVVVTTVARVPDVGVGLPERTVAPAVVLAESSSCNAPPAVVVTAESMLPAVVATEAAQNVSKINRELFPDCGVTNIIDVIKLVDKTVTSSDDNKSRKKWLYPDKFNGSTPLNLFLSSVETCAVYND